MDSQVINSTSETNKNLQTEKSNQQDLSAHQHTIPEWPELFQLFDETAAECKLLAKALNLVRENMRDAKKPEWLSSGEVIQILHISKRTLQNYRNAGIITFKKLKGKIYYRRSDLMTLLNS